MSKISELRKKSREELLKQISELKGQLLVLRFQLATGQLTDSHSMQIVKKDIARVFTVLKEKEQEIKK